MSKIDRGRPWYSRRNRYRRAVVLTPLGWIVGGFLVLLIVLIAGLAS